MFSRTGRLFPVPPLDDRGIQACDENQDAELAQLTTSDGQPFMAYTGQNVQGVRNLYSLDDTWIGVLCENEPLLFGTPDALRLSILFQDNGFEPFSWSPQQQQVIDAWEHNYGHSWQPEVFDVDKKIIPEDLTNVLFQENGQLYTNPRAAAKLRDFTFASGWRFL